MSQNAHTLLLFFSEENSYRKFLGILRLLDAGDLDQAEKIGADWGVDIAKSWNEDWFNHSISPTPKFIRLKYETSTGYNLPLDILNQLFDSGLRAACLEVFYDQVGEFCQFYFMDNQLVDKDSICNRFGKIRTIIDDQFESDSKDLTDSSYRSPIPINKLIKENAKQEAEIMEIKETLLALAKASRETGEDPLKLAKSALILRAAGKGLLHGITFGIVTALLFKGIWLWITLAIILTIILPLVYISQVSAEFDNKTDDGDEATC